MIQIKRILCPTDLSPQSDAALQYAVALARTYESQLLLCHCVPPTFFVDEAERERYRKKFEDAISLYTYANDDDAMPRCEGIIVEEDPAIGIPRTAAAQRIDLIVMRSRRRPLAAALLGSTAEAVCRTAPCPVLVTHPKEVEWEGLNAEGAHINRVLVATDFSNDSELAVRYGLLLAQEHQAELHLLHALPVALSPALATMPTGVESDFQRAARQLQLAVPNEAHLWCKVFQTVRAGQPYREILTYAEEHNIDLICLGEHGAGFTMRALFGSNADRVLRQAPCPVLIARPLKPAETAPANDGHNP
ncbi:MAG TPA: universal stress protein [Blastocatellia bacterium]|nr:universal stress protein [Blastocatellia bacterium]